MYQKPLGLPATGYTGAAGLTVWVTYAHNTLSVLVLLFAAMTLLTIVAELRHRHHKESA